jgi:hypothetical protein
MIRPHPELLADHRDEKRHRPANPIRGAEKPTAGRAPLKLRPRASHNSVVFKMRSIYAFISKAILREPFWIPRNPSIVCVHCAHLSRVSMFLPDGFEKRLDLRRRSQMMNPLGG